MMDGSASPHFRNVDFTDFEKVIFGLQHFLRWFEVGKRRQVIAEFEPDDRSVTINFYAPNEFGQMEFELCGRVVRKDCERFLEFIGKKFVEEFERGKKQRIIIDYDPQNKKVRIGVQPDLVTRSVGSSGINEQIGS